MQNYIITYRNQYTNGYANAYPIGISNGYDQAAASANHAIYCSLYFESEADSNAWVSMSADIYVDGKKTNVRSLSHTGCVATVNGSTFSLKSDTVSKSVTITKPTIDTTPTKPVDNTSTYEKGYNDGLVAGNNLGVKLGSDKSTHNVYAEIILTSASTSNAWIAAEIDLYVDGVKYVAKSATSINMINNTNGYRQVITTSKVYF